jgi:cell shape-determining protein MreD
MMQEDVDRILGLVIFFLPFIAALLFATFSPLRQFRQPTRALAIGIATAGIAGIFAALGMLRGTVSTRALLIIVSASILLGAFFSLLVSSESITQKTKDEIVHKSDDQRWRV